MTLEEFKLKQYRILARELKQHINKMLSFRAGASPITLGFLDALEEQHEQELARLKMHIDMLKPRKEGVPTPYITQSEISLARSQNISMFLKIPSHKKVNCLFHSDKVASMHIYGNTYYCFSCNAKGSVIDVVMKLRNCTFTQAVKFLINK